MNDVLSGDWHPQRDTSEQVTPPAPGRLPGTVPAFPLPAPTTAAHTHRGALFPLAGDSSKPEFQACHLFPLPLFLPVFGALDFLPHTWTWRNRRPVWDSANSCPQITSQPNPGIHRNAERAPGTPGSPFDTNQSTSRGATADLHGCFAHFTWALKTVTFHPTAKSFILKKSHSRAASAPPSPNSCHCRGKAPGSVPNGAHSPGSAHLRCPRPCPALPAHTSHQLGLRTLLVAGGAHDPAESPAREDGTEIHSQITPLRCKNEVEH